LQLSSLGAISYHWVLSLKIASWGHLAQVTFHKYPFFRLKFAGDFPVERPYLTQPVSTQAVSDFLLQYDNTLFFFVSELMDLLLACEDQSQADQPHNLAEGHPM